MKKRIELTDVAGPMGGIKVHTIPPKIVHIEGYSIPTALVFIMFGGEWPEFKSGGSSFCFDAVDHYEVHNGELVPCDMCGDWIPGPNFKLVMSDLEILW